MIVLDEQLTGCGIENAIARWYPDSVRFITDLRPGTIIKDAAIPTLPAHESEPTFVTINKTDFWRKVAISHRFCVVCLALPDSRANEVSGLLQRLLRHSAFQAKAQRMGHVVRLTSSSASYYTLDDPVVRVVEDW